ncbi:class I SAM-dependent methyltransferase [Cyanobium sp. ATX 6F1]|uniref:class I SAM-dependent methyltransferase n=1 Tax=unclassified Cyanobium TaxID=2627006 RepID=UPI0020CB7CB7|nr:methyltransferase regulatory domain-containing protein [Cyanobium sp. ATX 6F1]MCP9915178.1 class I SAM-dependent methyltransferase [Cyanobium sp. ATX 6F1]
MAWNHGYYSHGTYTKQFYRELAPNWIDFALLIRGHEPPRPTEGSPFRYLELGSGMGLGLCLLAAAYPEGTFLGVDFLPAHIAHSNWLANELGLENIRFLEADFLALAEDPAPIDVRPGVDLYDYVAAHGIATWVTQPVQKALLTVAAAALRPAGVFYCSYNTYPGWLERSAFRALALLELDRTDRHRPDLAYRTASDQLRVMMGSSEAPMPLARAFPGLGASLDVIDQQPANYLCQEFANEGWQPLYVAEMHQRCADHALEPAGSATLADLFEQLMAEPMRSLVLAESDPVIRQTLIDLATNKSFRRDLFVRGPLPLSPQRRQMRLAALQVRLQEPTSTDTYKFNSDFGELTADPVNCAALEAVLVAGPKSLGELFAATTTDVEELVLLVALLLSANRLGLDRGEAGRKALEGAQRINLKLMELMAEGAGYTQLVAPAIGSGVGFNLLQSLIRTALAQGLETDNLIACVLFALSEIGAELRGPQNELVSEANEQVEVLRGMAETLARERLPLLRSLGVFASGA